MKVSALKTKTFTDTTVAGLDAAIAAFVATVGEATLIDVLFAQAPGEYSAMLVYTT